MYTVYTCIYIHVTINMSGSVYCTYVLYAFWTEIFCSNLGANEQCQKNLFFILESFRDRLKQLVCAQKILVSGNGGSPNPIPFYGDFDPAVFSFQSCLKIKQSTHHFRRTSESSSEAS